MSDTIAVGESFGDNPQYFFWRSPISPLRVVLSVSWLKTENWKPKFWRKCLCVCTRADRQASKQADRQTDNKPRPGTLLGSTFGIFPSSGNKLCYFLLPVPCLWQSGYYRYLASTTTTGWPISGLGPKTKIGLYGDFCLPLYGPFLHFTEPGTLRTIA